MDYNAFPNIGSLIGQLLATFYAEKLPVALRELPDTKDLVNKGSYILKKTKKS